MKYIFGFARMLAFIIGTLLTVPVILVMKKITGNLEWTQLWHGMAARVFNINVRFMGMPRDHGDTPTVFLSNHISYLDIVVMGSTATGVFVAKSEVAGWPLFGFLAKIQNTIFIRRTREALEESKQKISAALHAGNNVILFGEGTSTDGRNVLPFKAGLLEVMYEPGLDALLQPVAIVIERVGGKTPDDQKVRDTYAWWKPEDTLAPHLWNFACAGGVDILVHYQIPLDPKDYPDRKALAQAATEAVAAEL